VRLDEVARELYAAPPDRFVAARNEYARQARQAGDQKLADDLRKLRRPTQSAWLVNLLLRERRALVDELLDVGAEFRGEPLTRDRLHELSTRRRELLHRLHADAEQLSVAAGVPLTAERAREVEATLAAAVADPDAAEQVRAGRLATPLSYSGLGPELQFAPAPPSVTPSTSEKRKARADAEHAADAARAAAERLVKEHTEVWQDAVRQRDGLARRREELRAELSRVQQRLDRVESDLAEAHREVHDAADALEQAKQAAAAPITGPAK
jgi:DNA repair exonuclease SbcCD ATPase subunit